jgi:hypothetical protein
MKHKFSIFSKYERSDSSAFPIPWFLFPNNLRIGVSNWFSKENQFKIAPEGASVQAL